MLRASFLLLVSVQLGAAPVQNSELWHTEALIDGKWVKAEGSFEVRNPFDEKVIAKVTDTTREMAQDAIKSAAGAFARWSGISAFERAERLERLAELVKINGDDLARLVTLETGKPLRESLDEVASAAGALLWMAAEGVRVHGETFVDPDSSRTTFTVREPLGVVAIVPPWDFPLEITAYKVGTALAAGCTAVVQPPVQTPLTILAFAELALQAGIESGVLNVVPTGKMERLLEVLSVSPVVRKINFSGTRDEGKELLKLTQGSLKRLFLDLGGNSPMIVFEDADLDKAVDEALGIKFVNAGQCCVSVNRFLIQDSIYDEFVKRFADKAGKMRCGNGLDNPDIGPLVNRSAKEKIERLVKDATAKGGQVVLGAEKSKGLSCKPIVIKGATPAMEAWNEEIFGPLALFTSFKSEEEAITLANETPYGLAAYFYTQDLNRSFRVAKALQAGSVGINTVNIYSKTLPFGGFKESGVGRDNGTGNALDDYTEVKSIIIGR